MNAGWEYRCCHIWDKGIAHIAGNANTKTLRKFPVVTEVCVQYVKKTFFESGKKVREEVDLDQDGKVDEWRYYEDARLVRIGEDSDGDGKPDTYKR